MKDEPASKPNLFFEEDIAVGVMPADLNEWLQNEFLPQSSLPKIVVSPATWLSSDTSEMGQELNIPPEFVRLTFEGRPQDWLSSETDERFGGETIPFHSEVAPASLLTPQYNGLRAAKATKELNSEILPEEYISEGQRSGFSVPRT